MRKVGVKRRNKKLKDEVLTENLINNSNKKSNKRKRSKKIDDPMQEDSDSNQEIEDTVVKTPKRSKSDDAEQYTVEAILDDKRVKNGTSYLVRWQGYSSEHDTWEPKRSLQRCSHLIQKYLREKQKTESVENEGKDYEVERILDVYFKKDGKREFLVSWKGYSAKENTWEPEENMDCADLITKFMSKVNRAKSYEQRDLRPQRAPPARYSSTMDGFRTRRFSKRTSHKERICYMDN